MWQLLKSYQGQVLPDGQGLGLGYVWPEEAGHDEGQEVLVERNVAFAQNVFPVADETMNF